MLLRAPPHSSGSEGDADTTALGASSSSSPPSQRVTSSHDSTAPRAILTAAESTDLHALRSSAAEAGAASGALRACACNQAALASPLSSSPSQRDINPHDSTAPRASITTADETASLQAHRPSSLRVTAARAKRRIDLTPRALSAKRPKKPSPKFSRQRPAHLSRGSKGSDVGSYRPAGQKRPKRIHKPPKRPPNPRPRKKLRQLDISFFAKPNRLSSNVVQNVHNDISKPPKGTKCLGANFPT